MKIIIVSLNALTPFSILGSRSVTNVEESIDYIPGSTLRGALANLWLKSNKPDTQFKNIFTEDKVIFGNLYKDGSKPIPLSAFSCKYNKGFYNDTKNEDYKHGVVDMLHPVLKEKITEVPIDKGKMKCCFPFQVDSKQCNAPLKRYGGYYINDYDGIKSVSVSKRLVFHTAIAPYSEVALEGNLYSLEVVEEGQIFDGYINIYNESFVEPVLNFIIQANTIFIGSDRSRGLGKFKIIQSQVINQENDETAQIGIKNRIEQFNKIIGLNNGEQYFSLTLTSDAIITDKFMRYKSVIEAEDIGIKNTQLLTGFSNTRIISGWNSLIRLPKDDVITITKGSVFVYSIDKIDDTILNKLHQLESQGIGKRRGEGFGRLSVCAPFHCKEVQ